MTLNDQTRENAQFDEPLQTNCLPRMQWLPDERLQRNPEKRERLRRSVSSTKVPLGNALRHYFILCVNNLPATRTPIAANSSSSISSRAARSNSSCHSSAFSNAIKALGGLPASTKTATLSQQELWSSKLITNLAQPERTLAVRKANHHTNSKQTGDWVQSWVGEQHSYARHNFPYFSKSTRQFHAICAFLHIPWRHQTVLGLTWRSAKAQVWRLVNLLARKAEVPQRFLVTLQVVINFKPLVVLLQSS
jgi:hypothetical protein